MYEKIGVLKQQEGKEDLFIENDQGKVYKVSYIVMYIWDKLDGETTLEEINEDIKSIVEEDNNQIDCNTITHEVVNQLLPCELAKKASTEVNAHQ